MSEVSDVAKHIGARCGDIVVDAFQLFERLADKCEIARRVAARIVGMAAGVLAVEREVSADDVATRKSLYLEVLDDLRHCVLSDHRNPRDRLAGRRTGGACDFSYGGINATFTVGFSLYADWRCAEIFISVDRTQGDLEANVRDAGILASFALQHGATLGHLISGVTHEEDGRGSSIVGVALNLVQAEIDRLRGDDPETPAGAEAGFPVAGGSGGAAEPCDADGRTAEHASGADA